MKNIAIKTVSLFCVITTVAICGMVLYRFLSPGYYFPPEGFVPNAETAIRIAEAVWLPIYGEDIYDKQPFIAEYNKFFGYWAVRGTLPEGSLGGVPEAQIRKRDGKVMFVIHGL